MVLRLACLLAIAALVLPILLFLDPSGHPAIAFAFVGNPLLGIAVLLWMLSWRRNE